MDHLLTATQVRNLCRPISSHYEDSRIEIYIPEAEQVDVKPVLGEQMYIDLLQNQTGTTLSDDQKLILDGGIYTIEGVKHIMTGLKTAISYFVYARIIKNSDGELTRTGFINKNLPESDRPPLKEKLVASDDAKNIGNTYLNEVIQFIQLKKLEETFTVQDQIKRTYTINALGD